MKIILERIACAPELNRAHIRPRRGAPWHTVRAPGCMSIREARAYLFAPVVPGIVATVRTEYPPEWARLNRTYSGRVPSRAAALQFAREKVRPGCSGGPLLSGDYLPAARVVVSCRVIGAGVAN